MKRKSVKKSIKKKKKKTEKKSTPRIKAKVQVFPSNLANIPANIKHLVAEDAIIVCVEPDGACGANSAAGHIFEDPTEGPKFRRVINLHICDRWQYYKNKIHFPYKRQVGNKGEWVNFDTPDEFVQFL